MNVIDHSISYVTPSWRTSVGPTDPRSRNVLSLESQSPTGGGFTVSGYSVLTCVQGSITAASYTVVVRATHDGGNGLHADLTLTITFTDVAPAAPEFVKPSPNTADDDHPIALLETIQAGETVLTLTATDADTDDSTLTFNMDASAEATRELFEIAGKELKVKDSVVNDYFDAEKDGVVFQYPIVLEVSDRDSSANLSTTIDVKDVNDNSPEFSGTFTTEIEANVPEGLYGIYRDFMLISYHKRIKYD
ncbi:cadherin-4-like [Mercenaria mercenaria]|uniref:cadherin-4-like n=1 Tax=Mercenaria mercenaria TaxID=6596 RepID=UPI00234E7264|nr:cadherin-4-like [Mercenaria mercenaria]